MKKIMLCWLFFQAVTGIALWGQSWKQYPYQPEKSLLRFPDDEGFHPHESIEWWYINGHARGAVTAHEYSFMVSYFYEPVLFFDGFRILSIYNETTGNFYTQTLPCTYPVLDTQRLCLVADIYGRPLEYFMNDTSDEGHIIPFDYFLKAASDEGAISIRCSAQKPPLIISDSGLVHQGASGYSYYYSLTDLQISGTITCGDTTEGITGIAWIDRQYGNFNPYEKENYEWLSVQMDNHLELNIWNIFTPQRKIPFDPAYRICCMMFPDGSSFSTSDFTMERLKYAYSPGHEQCYANQWLIKLDTLDIELLATVNSSEHEITLPFRFFEGSISVEGSVDGASVSGKGFAELLHTFDSPEIQVIYPGEGNIFNPEKELHWEILNPDEGNKLQFDVEISYDNELSFNKLIHDLTSTSFYWNPTYFSYDTLAFLRITAYSVDSCLNAQKTVPLPMMPLNGDYRACTGGQMEFTLSLRDRDYSFQWLKEGSPMPGNVDSVLRLVDLPPSASGEYRCVVNRFPFADTTCAFSLLVGDQYNLHEYLTLCEGDEFSGLPVSLPGPYLFTDTLSVMAGCDSIIYYHITVDQCTQYTDNMSVKTVDIIPDPAGHKITLQFPENFTGQIMILDLTGRCIGIKQLEEAKNQEIELPRIRSCIFIIRFSGTFNASYKISTAY